MELTLHTDQWYTASEFNDLTWWPLDYPPLSGYYAYLWGQVAYYFDPQIVAPYTSRGNESTNTILLMRISVIISDLLFLYPILLYLIDRKYLTYILCNPLLILIDHGHFQYNCILLGLTLAAATLLEKKHYIKASILFVMALNFKVMGLYYSLGFFVYILLNCNIKKIALIGITVVLTFGVIWFGFNPIEVLTAIFPVHRGLYQLQVATFWCFSNIFIKWQYVLTNPQLFKLSSVLTLIACIPSLITIRNKKFTVTLFLLAQAFFIFSFHVHEKTILLPLIMLLVNVKQFGVIAHDYSMAALISLHPLMIEDGLFKQYLLALILYGIYGMKQFKDTQYKGLLVQLYLKLRYIPYIAYIILAISQNFIQPPDRYPYIYELGIQMISLSVYAFVFIIGHSAPKIKEA